MNRVKTVSVGVVPTWKNAEGTATYLLIGGKVFGIPHDEAKAGNVVNRVTVDKLADAFEQLASQANGVAV